MRHPKHVSPTDLYHLLLAAPWRRVFTFVTGSFLAINAVFGLAFWLSHGVNGTDGTVLDHFFFSVQTFSTLGYGAMYPSSKLAHWIVTVESVCSLLLNAMVTGLVFSKFAASSKCTCKDCVRKEGHE